MGSLKALLMVEFYSTFKFNLLSKQNKNKKQRASKLGILCVYVLLAIMAGGYIIVITSFAISYQLEFLIFPLIATLVFAIVFILMLLKQFALYGRNDYDMLISLPVNASKIVFAKLSAYLVQSMAISFVLFIPSGIVYGISSHASMLFYLKLVSIAAATPLLPFVFSALVGVLFGFVATSINGIISRKLKILWSIASVTILMIAVVIYGYFSLNATKYYSTDLIANFASDFEGNIIARIINDILYNGNHISFIFYIMLCSAAFLLSMKIIAFFLPVINQRMMGKTAGATFKISTTTKHSQLRAIVGLELKRYFSVSIYVFNTLGVALISLILTGVILFVSPELIVQLLAKEGLSVSTEMINSYLAQLLPVLSVAMLLVTNTTNASISIEGKTFWLSTSLPFLPSRVYKAKLLVNFIIFLPIGMISAIAFSIKFRLDLLGYITLFMTPTVGILFVALLGLWLNLKFPNFDYQNPVEVVKAGSSVFGSMIGGLLLSVVLFATAILFSNVGILLVDGLLLIGSYILWHKIKLVPLDTLLE